MLISIRQMGPPYLQVPIFWYRIPQMVLLSTSATNFKMHSNKQFKANVMIFGMLRAMQRFKINFGLIRQIHNRTQAIQLYSQESHKKGEM